MAVVGTVDLRIRDYEPVQSVLSAGAQLVEAVVAYLDLTGVDVNDPDAGIAERPLCDALIQYRAAVIAAAEAVKDPEAT